METKLTFYRLFNWPHGTSKNRKPVREKFLLSSFVVVVVVVVVVCCLGIVGAVSDEMSTESVSVEIVVTRHGSFILHR